MTKPLEMLTYAAPIPDVSILAAGQIGIRTRLPECFHAAIGHPYNTAAPSPEAQCAERAVANTLENVALFAALALTAFAAGLETLRVLISAQRFIAAPLVRLSLHHLDMVYLRSWFWRAAVLGTGMIAWKLLA